MCAYESKCLFQWSLECCRSHSSCCLLCDCRPRNKQHQFINYNERLNHNWHTFHAIDNEKDYWWFQIACNCIIYVARISINSTESLIFDCFFLSFIHQIIFVSSNEFKKDTVSKHPTHAKMTDKRKPSLDYSKQWRGTPYGLDKAIIQ